jgi:hypothetical protein
MQQGTTWATFQLTEGSDRGPAGDSGTSGYSGAGTSGYSGASGAAAGGASYYICPRESGVSHAGGTYWSYPGWSAQVLSGQAYLCHYRPYMYCATGSDTPFKTSFSGPAMASGHDHMVATYSPSTPWATKINDINGIQYNCERNTVASNILPELTGIFLPTADGWLVPWFYGDASGSDWYLSWNAATGQPSVMQYFSLEKVTLP